MQVQVLLAVFLLFVSNVLALKGLKRNGSLRLLQDGPPVVGTPDESAPKEPKEGVPTEGVPKESMPKEGMPKEGMPKEGMPKEGMPKEGMPKEPKGDVVGPGGEKSKDKKGKTCKKAKKASPPPPNGAPTVRLLQNGGGPMEGEQMEGEYCLHGAVTEVECQAAMTGNLPKGHQRIKGDVEIDFSYKADTAPNDILNQVGKVFNSETAAEFIGCEDTVRFLAEETTNTGNVTSTDEVRVTGVGFQNMKTVGQGTCESTTDGNNCDTISSNVEIFYKGDPVTLSDQEEMFALLISTIRAQAADGDFAEIGTVENVELSSEISSATGFGSGLNLGKVAGIPAGVGAFLVIVGGLIIGYCLMRGNDNDDHEESNNVDTNARGDAIEAEAIAVIDDDEKESKWKFNPSKFL